MRRLLYIQARPFGCQCLLLLLVFFGLARQIHLEQKRNCWQTPIAVLQQQSTLFVRLWVGLRFRLVIIYCPHRARFSSTFSAVPPPHLLLNCDGFSFFFWAGQASFPFATLTLLVSAKFSFACFIFPLPPFFCTFCISSLFGATKSFGCLRQARRLLSGCFWAVQPVQPIFSFFCFL